MQIVFERAVLDRGKKLNELFTAFINHRGLANSCQRRASQAEFLGNPPCGGSLICLASEYISSHRRTPVPWMSRALVPDGELVILRDPGRLGRCLL